MKTKESHMKKSMRICLGFIMAVVMICIAASGLFMFAPSTANAEEASPTEATPAGVYKFNGFYIEGDFYTPGEFAGNFVDLVTAAVKDYEWNWGLSGAIMRYMIYAELLEYFADPAFTLPERRSAEYMAEGVADEIMEFCGLNYFGDTAFDGWTGNWMYTQSGIFETFYTIDYGSASYEYDVFKSDLGGFDLDSLTFGLYFWESDAGSSNAAKPAYKAAISSAMEEALEAVRIKTGARAYGYDEVPDSIIEDYITDVMYGGDIKDHVDLNIPFILDLYGNTDLLLKYSADADYTDIILKTIVNFDGSIMFLGTEVATYETAGPSAGLLLDYRDNNLFSKGIVYSQDSELIYVPDNPLLNPLNPVPFDLEISFVLDTADADPSAEPVLTPFRIFPLEQVRDCWRSPAYPPASGDWLLFNFSMPFRDTDYSQLSSAAYANKGYLVQLLWIGDSNNVKIILLDKNGQFVEVLAESAKFTCNYNGGFACIGNTNDIGYFFFYQPLNTVTEMVPEGNYYNPATGGTEYFAGGEREVNVIAETVDISSDGREALESEMDGHLSESGGIIPAIYKTALDELTAYADSLAGNGYTEQSRNNLDAMLTAAKTCLGGAATQSEIDEAFSDLLTAIEGLAVISPAVTPPVITYKWYKGDGTAVLFGTAAPDFAQEENDAVYRCEILSDGVIIATTYHTVYGLGNGNDGGGDNGGSLVWLWILLGAGLGVAAGVVLGYLTKKRKGV